MPADGRASAGWQRSSKLPGGGPGVHRPLRPLTCWTMPTTILSQVFEHPSSARDVSPSPLPTRPVSSRWIITMHLTASRSVGGQAPHSERHTSAATHTYLLERAIWARTDGRTRAGADVMLAPGHGQTLHSHSPSRAVASRVYDYRQARRTRSSRSESPLWALPAEKPPRNCTGIRPDRSEVKAERVVVRVARRLTEVVDTALSATSRAEYTNVTNAARHRTSRLRPGDCAVSIDHQPRQLRRQCLRLPPQLCRCLRGIPHRIIHLSRP